ncbi:hypothetical protein [Embleya sp. NPDC059259]|uniref:hypothetical protein n=1 Tax=unclassified Embleya TaxID=2699296 RepID=UPI00368CA3F6
MSTSQRESTAVVERIAREVLLEGLDDWVPIDTVIAGARDAPGAVAGFQGTAAMVFEHLLRNAFMRAGDLGENGFEAWPVTGDQAYDRVLRQCERLGWAPLGAGAWLANTPLGDDRVS